MPGPEKHNKQQQQATRYYQSAASMGCLQSILSKSCYQRKKRLLSAQFGVWAAICWCLGAGALAIHILNHDLFSSLKLFVDDVPSGHHAAISTDTVLKSLLPPDTEFAYTVQPLASNYVHYLRGDDIIRERGEHGACTDSLDVLAWIMDAVNEDINSTIMVAYGELIHLKREGDFVNATGKYFDDDIDMLISLDTLVHVAKLEPDLFDKFGWSMRLCISRDNNNYVVLSQLVASCGHEVDH